MKKIAFGILVGLLIGAAGTVFADTIQAVFSKFNIKIDERASVEIEPLVYDGKTYLPVREFGELLGYRVDYDDETKTIIFDSKQTYSTFEQDEWITLKELDQIYDVEIILDGTVNFVVGSNNFSIDYSIVDSSPKLFETEYGKLRLYKTEQGTTMINVFDWEAIYAKITS